MPNSPPPQPRRAVSLVAHPVAKSRAEWEEDADEINELAQAAGLDVLAAQTVRVHQPKAATYIGAGRVEQLRELLAATSAKTLVVARDLSAAQVRNLERELQCEVVDRSALILDIFARRARSFEGKLQVELAQCRRQMSRLAGGWTHLERQRGGIGLRGGPGEKQIEMDRRILSGKIRKLEARIRQAAGRDRQARRRREKNGALAVALVGYTNAGKSSLFQKLTGSGENGQEKIFATLDSSARRAWLGNGVAVVSDTVGFIRDLPHELIQGFRATLEGAATADISLVVVDRARPDWKERLAVAQNTLNEVAGIPQNGGDEEADGAKTDADGAGGSTGGGVGGSTGGSGRQIVVMNKIDQIGELPRAERDECGKIRAVWLSCKTGKGIPLLREALAEEIAAPTPPTHPAHFTHSAH